MKIQLDENYVFTVIYIEFDIFYGKKLRYEKLTEYSRNLSIHLFIY